MECRYMERMVIWSMSLLDHTPTRELISMVVVYRIDVDSYLNWQRLP